VSPAQRAAPPEARQQAERRALVQAQARAAPLEQARQAQAQAQQRAAPPCLSFLPSPHLAHTQPRQTASQPEQTKETLVSSMFVLQERGLE